VTDHGHVTPDPGGAVARCGGPATCSSCARERQETGQPVLTGLALSLNCEPQDVFPDTQLGAGENDPPHFARLKLHRSGLTAPVARLRRIGWLDQLGRVWLRLADWDGKGGSISPLLIDPGERDGC